MSVGFVLVSRSDHALRELGILSAHTQAAKWTFLCCNTISPRPSCLTKPATGQGGQTRVIGIIIFFFFFSFALQVIGEARQAAVGLMVM